MSQRTHLVVGAGPIGSAVARRLAAAGDRVRVVTRSGSGPDLPGVERVAADASDAMRLGELAAGSDVLYNCVNPQYHRWATDWPPIAAALLRAAETSGAVLVTTSNLYGYGELDGPMTEQTPLNGTGAKARVRIRMWEDALAAHRAGRIRATEARGADYVGPGAESHLGERTVPKLLAGKTVQVLGSPDTRHTWTYTEDMAATLVAIGADERAWGRAWHVPSALECTQREAIARLAALAGVPMPKVTTVPGVLLRALGLVNPLIRELPEVAYQLERPFVMDSSAAQRELGLVPTPADDVLHAILDGFRARERRAA
ncbi:MAG: NAD-dependent epimerase/dehydratase family protein [Actinomycetales bacterium]|nr:NAD-dependent epimerase/dehydratase family protein [Actinomycetales bacterium]